MVAPLQSDYSNKKGIYKNLYIEINSENKKKDTYQARKPKKGIYVELYKHIEFKNNDNNRKPNNLYALALRQFIKDILSQSSRCFSAVKSEIKMLIIACMVAKKPINSYIESNIQNTNYTSQHHPELVSECYPNSTLERC